MKAMASAFDFYWVTFGLPLSRTKGFLSDSVPFSVTDAGLTLGILGTVGWLWSGWRNARAGYRRPFLRGWAVFPAFLLALALGQGAFPWSLAPTAWRTSLPALFPPDSLSEADFHRGFESRQALLANAYDSAAFQSLSEEEAVIGCDTLLDAALADLGLPPGRQVRRLKPMGPLTTLLGLGYGGPAFHDPFFSEMAVIGEEDYPTPHFWRLTAACHESAHAKGFTREIDAELLTQAALLRSRDPRYRWLAAIHWLTKTGKRVGWPPSLLREWRAAGERRKRVEADQPITLAFRRLLVAVGLRNSPGKYGDRKKDETWNPEHPFFATLATWAAHGLVPGAGTVQVQGQLPGDAKRRVP